MANANGWGDGASNNNIGWGKGADNAIGWGDIHADSWAGLTDIVGAVAFTGLLDTYPNASAAFSLRKLRTAYTGSAIRVRRSSDNAEQDFGFVSNVLDTASLLTFCGVGNGFVTTWYDQSGNGYNASTATALNQPQVVASGAVIVENSKPSVKFDGSNDKLSGATITGLGATSFSVFTLSSGLLQAGTYAGLLSIGLFPTGMTVARSMNNTGFALHHKNDLILTAVGTAPTTGYSPKLFTATKEINVISRLFLNGVASTTSTAAAMIGTFTDANFDIGRTSSFALTLNGNIQEMVVYPTHQPTNRANIETNINTFYSAY